MFLETLHAMGLILYSSHQFSNAFRGGYHHASEKNQEIRCCVLESYSDGNKQNKCLPSSQTGDWGMSRLVTYPGQCEGLRCQRTQELWLLRLHGFLEGGTIFCLLLTGGKWSVVSGAKTSSYLQVLTELWKPPHLYTYLRRFCPPLEGRGGLGHACLGT